MIVRRRGLVYRRLAEGSQVFILVVVGICDDNLALIARLKNGSETGAVESEKYSELTGLPLVGDLTGCSSESMSTSMGSLVGGVSLTGLSTSDDAEPTTGWERIGLDDTDLDAGVDGAVGFASFAPGFPKKLMRLFCLMFSGDAGFSGAFCCIGMLDVERDGKDARRDATGRCGARVVACLRR